MPVTAVGGAASPGSLEPPKPGVTALVAVSGWQTAARFLGRTSPARQRHPAYTGGVWLAPWLLTPGVVDRAPGVVLPLDFDIRGARPRTYAARLAGTLPEMPPDEAGYRGWLAGRGMSRGADVLLYAASRVAFMPMMPGHGAHETTIGWFPGGTVTPVSAPLPAS
jgi:hypothetical protein